MTLLIVNILPNNSKLKNLLSIIIIIFSIFLIGFRDFNVGVDTANYIDIFFSIGNNINNIEFRDPLWDIITFFFNTFNIDLSYYFLLWAFIYIYAAYFGAKYYFKNEVVFFLILFLIVPNFFLFGVNTIRSGVAASIFIFSLRYLNDNNKKHFFLLILACCVHISIIVPIFFFFISKYFKSIKWPLLIWSLFLPFALLGISLINLLPFEIDRLSGYLAYENDDISSRIINFVLYSISPIILGVYTIYFKKKYDVLFIRLLNTYILSNIIYILAFGSEVAERFAYLSEFLMPFLLIYPLVVFRIWKSYQFKLSLILFIIFMLKAYKIMVL